MTTGRCPTLLVLCVFAALVHVQSSLAATYKVAGSSGWIIPSIATFYDDWASQQTFQVGDVLEFDDALGAHSVLEVTPADASTCTTSSPIFSWTTASPKVTLNTPGAHSFICGVPGHCILGMKMTVTVTPAPPAPQLPPPTKAPSKTPPATPSLPPPPPRRSSPPPQPKAPQPAPVSTPVTPAPAPKKAKRSKRSLAPAPAPMDFAPLVSPSSTLAVAPVPVAEKAAATVLRSTTLMILATIVVSCGAAVLF